MAKRKKWIDAGDLHREVIYTPPKRSDDARVRAKKKKLSSEAQKRFNRKTSAFKLMLILAENFNRGDLVVGLDYSDKYLPKNREEAQKRIKAFRAKLAKYYRASGRVLLMVWNIEHLTDKGGRYHHHCVINGTGEDLEILKKLWTFGGVDLETLRVDKEKNYRTLAEYMAKEGPEKNSQRSWSYTRSCRQPEIDSRSVPDDTPLQVPKGAILFEHIKENNQYGYYEIIEYYLPTRKRLKTKRKRRR